MKTKKTKTPPAPYCGITGFTDPKQVESVLGFLRENYSLTNSPRLFMIGVLASDKSLAGKPSNPNRYPPLESIKDILPNDARCLNLVHFNSKATDCSELFSQLCTVMDAGGENCHGLQLNIAHPPPSVLCVWKQEFPEGILVLQCGGTVLNGITGAGLVEHLQHYSPWIDYVLLDSSGGRGQPINIPLFCHLVQTLVNEGFGREMGIGVAGGLYEKTIPPLKEIASIYHPLSMDMEGGVRDGKDQMDAEKAARSLLAAFQFFDQF